jgi:hypothetical protein
MHNLRFPNSTALQIQRNKVLPEKAQSLKWTKNVPLPALFNSWFITAKIRAYNCCPPWAIVIRAYNWSPPWAMLIRSTNSNTIKIVLISTPHVRLILPTNFLPASSSTKICKCLKLVARVTCNLFNYVSLFRFRTNFRAQYKMFVVLSPPSINCKLSALFFRESLQFIILHVFTEMFNFYITARHNIL